MLQYTCKYLVDAGTTPLPVKRVTDPGGCLRLRSGDMLRGLGIANVRARTITTVAHSQSITCLQVQLIPMLSACSPETVLLAYTAWYFPVGRSYRGIGRPSQQVLFQSFVPKLISLSF